MVLVVIVVTGEVDNVLLVMAVVKIRDLVVVFSCEVSVVLVIGLEIVMVEEVVEAELVVAQVAVTVMEEVLLLA